MAKIDPKNLTIDPRKLLNLTVQDRMSFFKTNEGQSYLASLSPIEYNKLISSYHQKQLAPLTRTSTGGGGTATATASGRPSAAPSGPSATPTPAGPQQPGRQQVRPAGPTVGADTRFAWEKRLEELANQARGQQQGQQQREVLGFSRQKFQQMFKGTGLENQYDTIVSTAQKYNMQPSLVAAIMAHETGKGKNLRGNNPAGIMDPSKNWKVKKQYDTLEQGIDDAIKTMKRNFDRGGGTIEGMGRIYAPVGAANDPNNLNRHWPSGVGKFMKDLGETSQQPLSPGVKPEEAARTGGSGYTQGPTRSGETRQEQREKFVDRTEEMNAANYGSKNSKQEPYKFIGVHYTGGESLSSAINVAKNKNVGYQYLIDKDGTVHMVQDPDKGRSNHWGKNNIHQEAKNNNSVGISFVGSSNKTITKEQIQAGLRLIEQQRQKYGIDPKNVLGHGETTRNHRADTEGYGLLEPFRQRHGLTPQTGNMPNIASDGGIRAWKAGNYNYNLETLQEREEKTKEITKPQGYENLPEDIRKAIDELPESRRNSVYNNLTAFAEKHSNWIETYTQAHREAIDQGANSQEAAKNIAETASVSPNSAASVAPGSMPNMLPGTTAEVTGESVTEQQQKLGATRKLAIDPNLKDKIEEAVLSVYGPGYKVKVYSGGQPEIGTSSKRKGTTRHDLGRAADVYVYTPDGKRLMRQDQMPLAQYWASKGYGGIGIGMRGGGMHLDIHKTGGNNAWGYVGQDARWNNLSANEKAAIAEAKKEGFVAPISRQEFSDYSKRVAERTNVLQQQGLTTVKARQQARVEVREQINQTIRERQAAAATQTAPVVPTQTQQPVSPGVSPEEAARTGGSGYNQTPTPSGQIPGSVAPAPAAAAPAPAPAAPAPAPAAAAPAPAAPEQPTAEPTTEKPPTYEDGGEQQLDGENLSVVNTDTGQVEAKFNDTETAVFRNNRMEVTPASRENSVGIEDRTNQIQSQEQTTAEQQSNQLETPMETRMSQHYDSGYNQEWQSMMQEVKEASSQIYKSPTAARAYDAHRFASSGDVFKHFSFKTPTLKF